MRPLRESQSPGWHKHADGSTSTFPSESTTKRVHSSILFFRVQISQFGWNKLPPEPLSDFIPNSPETLHCRLFVGGSRGWWILETVMDALGVAGKEWAGLFSVVAYRDDVID